MFNGITPYQTIKPDRKAEHSAAHQNHLRSNPDGRRRQDQSSFKEELEEQDLATVSVDSLYLFLQSALPQGNSGAFNAPANQTPQPQAPTNPAARQAASAYGRHAQQPAAPTTQTSVQKDLSPQDITTIQSLMADLKLLKTKGITRLKIQEGTHFLDSLVKAITKAKSTL